MPKAFYNGIELKPLDMPVGYSGRPVLAFLSDSDGINFGDKSPYLILSRQDDCFMSASGSPWEYAYQLPEDFQFTTTPDKPKKIPHTYKDLRDKIVMLDDGYFGRFSASMSEAEWTSPLSRGKSSFRKFCSTWEQADKGEWTDIVFAEDCE